MHKVQWEVIKNVDSKEVLSEVFETPQKAVSFITNKVKENKSLVVLIDENKDGFREKNIKKKISEIRTNLLKTQTEIKKKEFEKMKSLAFKQCSHCESKVNTDFLKNIDCPVCYKAMLSIPSRRKLLEIQNKLKMEKNKLETVQKSSKKYHIRISVNIENRV